MSKKEKIAFYSEWDDVILWKKAFNNTDFEIKIWPDEVNNKDKIKYALVWDAPSQFYSELKDLIFIQSLGAGVDHILKNKIKRYIRIAKLYDKNLITQLAEYATMAVLICQKGMHNYIFQQKERIWKQNLFNYTSNNFNVLLLGYGDIGKAISNNLIFMGYNLSAWRKTKGIISDQSKIKFYYGNKQLDYILNKSDIIICTLPSTKETINLINMSRLKHFKRGSYLINIGRGNTINERDLLIALEKEILAGAILDVFNDEPLPFTSKLWSSSKVILTPHIGGLTQASKENARLIIDNCNRANMKADLLSEVNIDKGY